MKKSKEVWQKENQYMKDKFNNLNQKIEGENREKKTNITLESVTCSYNNNLILV